MILLLLAGCSAEVVAEEYHLSEQGLGAAWKTEAAGRLLRNPVFKGSDSHDILRMVGAREDVMRAVIIMMERQWGSVEGYLRGMIGVNEYTIGTHISELLFPLSRTNSRAARYSPEANPYCYSPNLFH